tara:strand:- start:2450 stop:2992 length:543 start_codon:yes stop_codon:yes gene_type:complete
MSGWLYLIRNRDLYKIGITKKFENRMRQLKPDNVVAKLYTNDFVILERELHKRYKKYRIPQTEYFRLEKHHVKEIKLRISDFDNNLSIFSGIFIKSLLFIILIHLSILILISLNINDIKIISLKSILLMERISFVFSFLSLIFNSGKYFNHLGEFKYRVLRLIAYMIFTLFFRLAYVFLQ